MMIMNMRYRPPCVRIDVASGLKFKIEKGGWRCQMKYSLEIKELVVQKRLSGSRSVKELSDEFGISTWTIRQWLRNYQENGTMAGKEKRPRDWTAPERVEALIEASQLQEEERGSWCRSRGLHSHHLNSWKRMLLPDVQILLLLHARKQTGFLKKKTKT